MESMNAGLKIEGQKEDLLVIRSDHRFAKALANVIVLSLSLIGGNSLVNQLKKSEIMAERATIFSVMILWIAVVGLIVASLVWTVFSAQVILFRTRKITFRYQIFGLRIGRQREFEMSRISDIRVAESIHSYKGKQSFEYAIEFEYDGTRRFLLKRLSERQADAVRIELAKRISETKSTLQPD